MRKNIINVGICMLFILSAIGLKTTQATEGHNPSIDEIDQSFVPENQIPFILQSGFGKAYGQSFTPAKGKSTRMQLLLSKTANYPDELPLHFEIYRYMQYGIMFYKIFEGVIQASEIPITNPSFVTITIPNLPLIAEDSEYYIKLKPDWGVPDMHISWWYSTNDPYDRGCSWFLNIDQWEADYDKDFIFKTYGVNPTPAQLVLDPTTLAFGTCQRQQTLWANVTVTNTGPGDMYWDIDPFSIPLDWNIEFLTSDGFLYDQYGFIDGGESHSIMIKIITASSSQGLFSQGGFGSVRYSHYQYASYYRWQNQDYNASIIFRSNGGTVELAITYRISVSLNPSPLSYMYEIII